MDEMIENLKHPEKEVRVALVGKYTQLHDAYISVVEALKHGGIPSRTTVDIKWVDSERLKPDTVDKLLGDVSGILVPGGFGNRGVDGKILAAEYARKIRYHILGCVWACRWQLLNLRAMCANFMMLTALNWTRRRRIRSLL